MIPDSGEAAPQDGGPPRDGRGWMRVLALFFVSLALSVIQPSVLAGIPLVMLVAGVPLRSTAAWVGAGLAAFLALKGGAREGLWYVDRGWAIILGGWFVALTIRWPMARFTTRGLGALTGAGAVTALILGLRPGAWGAVDWRMGERLRSGIASALEGLRMLKGEEGLPPGLVEAIHQTAEAQAHVFPATVGLASLAALGVAWWVYVRLGYGSDGGLGPLREFRFNDHMVWLFIAGLVLLALGGGMERIGSNAVVFMGALYALRGAAVLVFVWGGVSVFGALMLVLGLLFLPPVMLAGALVVGLGDTWLDIRRRIREATV